MLIGTSDIRNWLGLEEGDREPNAKLEAIAKAVQDFCCTVTGRQLEAKFYATDPENCYLDGLGDRFIYLPQYPVSSITTLNIDSERVWGSATLISTDDYIFYSSGKVYTEEGSFTLGRRNVYAEYTAGFAPIVGGTWNSAVSTYPIPNDLKQVMVEMSVEAFKEGLTAVHSIAGPQVAEPKFIQMMSGKSFWRQVLNYHSNYGSQTRDE